MSAPTPASYRRHRLNVAAYHRMGDAGIFSPGERVELIEGEIVDRAPIGCEHAGTVNYLTGIMVAALAGRAIVATQNPVMLGLNSEPQPDIALLRPRADFYRGSHPRPEDVLLVVEVADTTLRYDREVKVPLYARHGIPEAWIVDLQGRALNVFREPATEGYRQVQVIERPARLAPLLLPDLAIDLAGLF
jgi:Uma2 family endonuclease